MRRQDSNLRPPGYEPDELPTALLRDIDLVPVTGLEPVQYRYRGILSPLCLPIPPHRQLSAMIRIPYSPVIVKHGQGKPFKFFRQLPLQKVQTGARFRAIFRPEAHILAENPNAKEEIK